MVIDQVCKKLIDEKKAKIKGTYDGIVYYFCSEKCKKVFGKRFNNYKSMLNIRILSSLF